MSAGRRSGERRPRQLFGGHTGRHVPAPPPPAEPRPTELEIEAARRAVYESFPLSLDSLDRDVLAVVARQQNTAAQVLDGALRAREEGR